MGRRGRRPHPDILTPREWEVLDLLRERLTNEQIAQRLDITLDGAKYHVSQILSKLSVATRDEAAVWQTEEARPWWQRMIALPVAAKIAGAAMLIATASGLAVLAWSVVTTETDKTNHRVGTWAPPSLPQPVTEPTMTRDQALLRGARGESEVASVDARASELGAILRYQDGPISIEIPELAGRRSTVTAWLVTTVGVFPAPDRAPPGIVGTTTPPEIACREVSVVFRDDETESDPSTGPTSSYSVSNALPESMCDRLPELTRDLAVVYGWRAMADRFAPFAASPAVTAFFPREIPAERTTFADAVAVMEQEDVLGRVGIWLARGDEPVWTLRFRGPFAYPPQAARGNMGSAVCTEVIVIIHAETGQPLLDRDKQIEDC